MGEGIRFFRDEAGEDYVFDSTIALEFLYRDESGNLSWKLLSYDVFAFYDTMWYGGNYAYLGMRGCFIEEEVDGLSEELQQTLTDWTEDDLIYKFPILSSGVYLTIVQKEADVDPTLQTIATQLQKLAIIAEHEFHSKLPETNIDEGFRAVILLKRRKPDEGEIDYNAD